MQKRRLPLEVDRRHHLADPSLGDVRRRTSKRICGAAFHRDWKSAASGLLWHQDRRPRAISVPSIFLDRRLAALADRDRSNSYLIFVQAVLHGGGTKPPFLASLLP